MTLVSISKIVKRADLPPMVWWCWLFCLGIIAEFYWEISFVWLCCFASIFLVLAFIFLKYMLWPQLFLPPLALLLGALTLANAEFIPSNSIAHLTPYRGEVVSLQGIVISDPHIVNGKSSFTLEVFKLSYARKKCSVSGKVFVRSQSQESLFYGDELIIKGKLYKPFDWKPGYADFLKYRRIYSIASVKGNGCIKKEDRRRGNCFKYLALILKHKLKNKIAASFSPFAASILNAMLLGERQNLSPLVKKIMIKAGTWHILVVSGAHAGMVAFIILLFLKILRVRQKLRYLLAMGFLAAYSLLVGLSVPVVRAVVMAASILAGYLIKRNCNFYNSLSLAALLILFFDPRQLFCVGFQLSFLSVFFIVWLSPKIESLLPKGYVERPVFGSVARYFCVCLSAWLGTAPLIAYVFGNFSLIAVPANMAVVPVAMLVLASGFAFVIIAAAFPFFSCAIAFAVEFLTSLLFKINFFFSAFSLAYLSVPDIPLTALVSFYILIFLSISFSCNLKKSK